MLHTPEMEERKDVTVPAAAAHATVTATLTARVGVRNYRATQLLWAARRAARESREIEADLAGTHRPSIELGAVVTNAVLLAVAFMEASVNEVLQDIAESKPGALNSRCVGIAEDAALLIRELWMPPARLERAGILEKYQVALTASRKPPLAKGANPYQAASKLIDLRNALVHFKPEWQMDDDEHVLERKLDGLFPLNAIFREPVSPWYPNMCLSAGCADWANSSATALVDEWWRVIGLVRDYHEELRSMPTP